MGEQENIKTALLVGYSDGYQDSRDGVQYDSASSLRRHLALAGIDDRLSTYVAERSVSSSGDQADHWSVIERAGSRRIIGTSFTDREASVIAEVLGRVDRSANASQVHYVAEHADRTDGCRWSVIRIDGPRGIVIGSNFDECEARHCAAALTLGLLK